MAYRSDGGAALTHPSKKISVRFGHPRVWVFLAGLASLQITSLGSFLKWSEQGKGISLGLTDTQIPLYLLGQDLGFGKLHV